MIVEPTKSSIRSSIVSFNAARPCNGVVESNVPLLIRNSYELNPKMPSVAYSQISHIAPAANAKHIIQTDAHIGEDESLELMVVYMA